MIKKLKSKKEQFKNTNKSKEKTPTTIKNSMIVRVYPIGAP